MADEIELRLALAELLVLELLADVHPRRLKAAMSDSDDAKNPRPYRPGASRDGPGALLGERTTARQAGVTSGHMSVRP